MLPVSSSKIYLSLQIDPSLFSKKMKLRSGKKANLVFGSVSSACQFDLSVAISKSKIQSFWLSVEIIHNI